MGDELAASLARGMADGDRLFLPDPVYHGGTVDRTRGSEWLAEAVRSQGGEARYVGSRDSAAEAILAEALDGDRILVMGARDDSLSEFAADLVEKLR